MRRAIAPLLLFVAALGFAAEAEKPQIWKIDLEPNEKFDDAKVAVLEAATDTVGQRYLVSGLKIMEPVTVIVKTKSGDDQVDIALTKWAWDDPAERKGSTKGTGEARFDFRTEGELMIDVRSPQETQYQLIVWKGQELPVQVRDGFVTPDEYARKNAKQPQAAAATTAPASSTSPVLWVIAGLLGAIVVLLAVFVLRRKSA